MSYYYSEENQSKMIEKLIEVGMLGRFGTRKLGGALVRPRGE
jgi:hypothetical protein